MTHHKHLTGRRVSIMATKLLKKWEKQHEVKRREDLKRAEVRIRQEQKNAKKEDAQKEQKEATFLTDKYAEANFIKVKWPTGSLVSKTIPHE